MKNLFRLVVLVLLLGGWTLAALSLHVVRSSGPDGETVALVPKNTINPMFIMDTYVDTRGWTLDDVKNHRRVVERLIQVGKADLLANVIGDARGVDVEHELRNVLASEPSTRQSTRPSTFESARQSSNRAAKDAVYWSKMFK